MTFWSFLTSVFVHALDADKEPLAWSTVLAPYGAGSPRLLEPSFLDRHGTLIWNPGNDDRQAAAKLHMQLVSRISTQRLPYQAGIEKTALDSLYSLFQTTRDIIDKHPDAHHFDALAWYVINTHLRPFTAKWHRESVAGALTALDGTDVFRAELQALQPMLIEFDRLLLHLRDNHAPPPYVEALSPHGQAVATEMNAHVAHGIPRLFNGLIKADEQAGVIGEINKAENDAIDARRKHYRITNATGASGLAISGGGIRSATFSLGVLIALAERGLLPYFDYLSTVSGGGYLGSFLSVFLQSPRTDVGLRSDELPFRRKEGEAAALRHIRHHSKYLVAGATSERFKMLAAQLYGMAINIVAVAWIVLVAVLIERFLRSILSDLSWVLAFVPGVLAVVGVAWLLLLRWRSTERVADTVVVWVVGAAAAVGSILALAALRIWSPPAWVASIPLGDAGTWTAILGALPAAAPLFQAIAPRLFARIGSVLAALSAIAAPLFAIALYVLIWNHEALVSEVAYLGYVIPLSLLIVGAGFFVYAFLFDVNMTSPHRYYRRKLAEAYLIQPTDVGTGFKEAVAVRISALASEKAPYHLINCALNVPASTNASMQGRLTDFFLFSRAYSGSPLLGYYPTTQWETRDPNLDTATAMAISGAAASPQMGTGTITHARFWLALLNVRLGYWTKHPKNAPLVPGPPGVSYLFREMLGWLHERSGFINLSDGGHIENLAIYELLRRRCKFIVAIDGEEDARMTFQGLTTLQRMAEIDLGVQLDLDLDLLRLDNRGLSQSHFRFCRIRYPRGERGSDDDFGYLLYLKLSLTGNEGEFIRRYRLDEPAFPHHSTADQFFSEAQFEAYRSLGEHVGKKLFLDTLVGPLASRPQIGLEEWFTELGKNLLPGARRKR